MIIDVVFAVNRESKTAPANIQMMQRIRAKNDLGALSPYLKMIKITRLRGMARHTEKSEDHSAAKDIRERRALLIERFSGRQTLTLLLS